MIAVFCAISICSAASRSTWAFARDNALPFSPFFSRVSSSSSSSSSSFGGLPINAYLLSTFVQLLLGLIYLGSSTAFNAFVGVAVMCLQAAYAMPVAISLWHRRVEFQDIEPEDSGSEVGRGVGGSRRGYRFSLGRRWGYVINGIAVMWTMFEIVLFSMPPVVPVTKTTMSACVPTSLSALPSFETTND